MDITRYSSFDVEYTLRLLYEQSYNIRTNAEHEKWKYLLQDISLTINSTTMNENY